MKITDVQACIVGQPVPHSGGSVWTFVRIYTDKGIVGTGECNSAGPMSSGLANKEMILSMKQWLIGEDPLKIGPLYEMMRRRARYGGGSTAPTIFAITGIENALWDIAGKAMGAPVHQLLGGKFRDEIRLYADCHAGETTRRPPMPRRRWTCSKRVTAHSSLMSITSARASGTATTGPSAPRR